MRLATAVVILLVAFAVLQSIYTGIKTIDPSTIPEEWKFFYDSLIYIFGTTSTTILFTFARNILGYAENWFGTHPEARKQLKYEARKLGETWAKYQASIMSLTAGLQAIFVGTPWQTHATYIAGATAFILDLITKKLNDIAAAFST